MSLRLIVYMVFVLAAAQFAQAAPGDIDTSFSGDGIAITDFDEDRVSDIAIQSNGRIVVVGSAEDSGGDEDLALARYNAGGSPDNNFSGDGKVTTDCGDNVESANAVAIQSDGKIVVAGDSGGDFAVVRYNAGGTLDNSFSGDGKLLINFSGSSSDVANAVVIQSDGKIVVAGVSNNDFALARVNTNGTLDTSFSGDGMVTTSFGGSDSANAVALITIITSISPLTFETKIIAAGTGATSSGADRDFALARYNLNGTLDNNFSGDGRMLSDFGGLNDSINAIAIEGSSQLFGSPKIVVAGVINRGNGFFVTSSDFALARYSSGGTLDNSFDGNGVLSTDFGKALESASDVAIQTDGKIVAAGTSSILFTADSADFVMARYNTNGALDATFSGDGKVITDLEAAGTSSDFASAIAIQPNNGRIVAAGFSNTLDVDFDFALARYHAFACNGLDVTILGTQGSNTINGTSGLDIIHGLAGNDTIIGLEGNDTICGGDGNDTIEGRLGNDTLLGENGDDLLKGQGGSDTCNGGVGNDTTETCEDGTP